MWLQVAPDRLSKIFYTVRRESDRPGCRADSTGNPQEERAQHDAFQGAAAGQRMSLPAHALGQTVSPGENLQRRVKPAGYEA